MLAWVPWASTWPNPRSVRFCTRCRGPSSWRGSLPSAAPSSPPRSCRRVQPRSERRRAMAPIIGPTSSRSSRYRKMPGAKQSSRSTPSNSTPRDDMKSAISKQELLDNMHAVAREFVDAVRRFPEEEWSQGRYEEGWTAKDILAHVASIEWTYPRLLELAEVRPQHPETERRPRGLVDDYNRRQVDKRKETAVEELLVEFQRNRASTIAAVEDADESVLDERV